MIAAVAHELAAPMTTIECSREVLERRLADQADATVMRALDELRVGSRRLRTTTEEILHYSRIDGQGSTPVALADAMRRVSTLVAPILRHGGHRMVVEQPASVDNALVDPIALEQVVVNLVVNAAEANVQSAFIDVRVSRTKAPPPGREPAETAPTSWLRLSVHDDGPGIPEHVREYMFDSFYSTKPNGTGLGLAVSRSIARRAGGDLWFDSSAHGTRFVLQLPFAPVEGARS